MTPISFCWEEPQYNMKNVSRMVFSVAKVLHGFSCSSQTFPDCCIFISTELVHVHLDKYLPPFLQGHLYFWRKKSFRIRLFTESTILEQICSSSTFHIADSTFDAASSVSLKNIYWSWELGEKFTGWKKNKKIPAATEVRISLCTWAWSSYLPWKLRSKNKKQYCSLVNYNHSKFFSWCTRDGAILWTKRFFAPNGKQFTSRFPSEWSLSIRGMWKLLSKSSLVLFSKLKLIKNWVEEIGKQTEIGVWRQRQRGLWMRFPLALLFLLFSAVFAFLRRPVDVYYIFDSVTYAIHYQMKLDSTWERHFALWFKKPGTFAISNRVPCVVISNVVENILFVDWSS